MQSFAWVALAAIAAALAYSLWRARKRWRERTRAAEARAAEFLAQLAPPKPAAIPATAATRADAGSLPQQKLLFEAAAKAAEAGEPALAIQLYARLLARYPHTAFAAQVRAAVDVQKGKLAKS